MAGTGNMYQAAPHPNNADGAAAGSAAEVNKKAAE